jgi:hypothetical protein
MLRVALTAAALSLAASAAAQVPNTFTAGTPAKAAEVNANFLYLDGRVTALAGELASGVTVANTLANPVPVSGAVTVGNSAADPVNVRLTGTVGDVSVRNTAASPLAVTGSVSVNNTAPVPVTVTNNSGNPAAVTVANPFPVQTYVSNGFNSPVPVSLTNGPMLVTTTSPLAVNVQRQPTAVPIAVRLSGSNTSWVSATITFGSLSSVYVESVAVRCPYGATVAMAGIGSVESASGPLTIAPLDPASMNADRADMNVVWPTTVVAGTSVLPPTSVNLPVGNSFSFWVGNGASSGPIDCTGTLIVRPVY